jgi:hypothetical protein
VNRKVLKHFTIFIFLAFCIQGIQAQKKNSTATRFVTSPAIDGILDDEGWKLCDSIDDFNQFVPVYNVKPTQRTVVRIGYDDDAIYVGAMMYDSAPDSILRELGSRDDDLNADKIAVQFDTYNMQTDAYTFMVYASGVQLDFRQNDGTYSAVWQSAVKITDKGWACEMKINYSALRFPKEQEQKWGMQIFRGIRRHREADQWSLEVKSQANILVNWGLLEGIKDVNPSLRLSLTPFISLYGDHFPYNEKGKSNYSYSFSGGLDLKYGINESFTLDVTLLPDFSQVQSDYQVKNISAFETVYQEYRPFFTEAIDLFKEGDLFYTRRIGRTPVHYDDIEDSVTAGEVIRKNPHQAKLINAIKFSGRNKHGTAFGVFNAITNNMYATVEDSLGNKRRVLTEPLTNYNILVFDQILKHNSKIYFVNTNVIRDKKYDDSNVSLLGFLINDKKNVYQLSGLGAISLKIHSSDSTRLNIDNTLGYKYSLFFGKVSGKFQFNAYRNEMNHTWDANDLGLTLQNNRTTTGINVAYSIYEPFWKLRDMYSNLSMYYIENFLTKRVEEFQMELHNNFTTKKYLTIWENFSVSPLLVNNFAETRVPGRYFVVDRWWYGNVGFSSDYRKLFALDMSSDYWQDINGDAYYYGISTTPIFRISRNFLFRITSTYSESYNDVGFADMDDLDNIIFGKRDITTVENQLHGRYMFRNNLSLSLTVRHYWSKGRYSEFYKLDNDGILITDPLYNPGGDYDFNFNAFNIDLMFYWEFAPGSSLNITYKNNIGRDDVVVNPSYFRNFGNIFAEKQLNSLSIKVLYYLDYQNVKKHKKKKK